MFSAETFSAEGTKWSSATHTFEGSHNLSTLIPCFCNFSNTLMTPGPETSCSIALSTFTKTTSSDNILAPNAGIDKSNAKKGKVILYPFDPYLVAEQLRRKFFLKYLIHVGIIIVDSRLMPSRVGTTGVAIACSGIEPVLDMRSQKDLEGNPLKVTFQAVVDNLASKVTLRGFP